MDDSLYRQPLTLETDGGWRAALSVLAVFRVMFRVMFRGNVYGRWLEELSGAILS